MTIGSITARVTFNCDGVSTVFPVPIQSYLAGDFTVELTAPISAGGGTAALTLNSDYSLAASSSDAPPKWTLTTLGATPYAAGYKLQVFINPTPIQQTQYVQGQQFPSAALQTNVDRLTQMVQRLQDQVNRAIRVPDGDVAPQMLLPITSQRLNQYLITDANGNISTGIPNTQIITTALLAPFLNLGQTAGEAAAGITPVNLQYPAYTVDRYATNTVPGTTDMWQAIQNANNAAAAAGANVRFLPGEVYGVNCTAHAAALSITASWTCTGPRAEIRRLDFNTSTAYFTALMLNQFDLVLRGLKFNGQVTTVAAGTTPNVDLGVAGSYGDNASESLWSKPYGVRLALTQNCTVDDCVFINFLRAGLWVDANNGIGTGSSSNPPWPSASYGTGTPSLSLANRVTDCWFQRNRGIFGDCLIAEETEDLYIGKCYATDYQRIGFVFNNASPAGYIGVNGVKMEDCIADFGHDAVISGSQSNAGFWMELGDGFDLVNCESKNTMIGFFAGFSAEAAQGVWRPYTASHTFTGCKAIRCRQQGYRLSYADDVAVTLVGCFAEVNRGAAAYANCVGGAPCGVEIDFTPPGAVSAASFTIGCTFDMVGFGASGLTQYAGINVLQGGVTNFYQMKVNYRDCHFRWLTTAGAADNAIQGLYESVSGSNFGYLGDIVFTGLNNGGSRFQGSALISNCVDHTFGYLLMSSEIVGGSSVLTVENCNISMRTGGATSNNGTLFLKNCKVDVRGNPAWALVSMADCTMVDFDTGNTDRTAWGPTEMKLSNCLITRQLRLAMNGGITTNRLLRLTANGCEWNLNFEVEPGLRLLTSAGTFAQVNMSGCTFRNNGNSTPSANAMIMCDTTTGTIQFAGAGNTFDAVFVSGAGGHVVETSTTGPTFNDAPQTVAAPFLTVFGAQMTFSGF